MIVTALPSVPASIIDEYVSLVSDLDRLVLALSQDLRHFITCGPGCFSCCRRFAVLPLEAALINGAPITASTRIQDDDSCPFLSEGFCSIYAQRPLICRTQGLPIGYVHETHERIEVSACPLNFSDDHPFDYEDLLLLDPFNHRLAALNLSYCQMAGISADRRLPLG